MLHAKKSRFESFSLLRTCAATATPSWLSSQFRHWVWEIWTWTCWKLENLLHATVSLWFCECMFFLLLLLLSLNIILLLSIHFKVVIHIYSYFLSIMICNCRIYNEEKNQSYPSFSSFYWCRLVVTVVNFFFKFSNQWNLA